MKNERNKSLKIIKPSKKTLKHKKTKKYKQKANTNIKTKGKCEK